MSHSLPPLPDDPDGTEPTRDPTPAEGADNQCESADVPEPPFQLDEFEVLRRIGRGGQGFVYEAFDNNLDRSAALKIVIAKRHSPDALDRFEREGKALAKLNHPNIVTIYTSKTTAAFGDAPARYFAMEYFHAALPVTEYADQHGLPIHKRVSLARTLCLAIEAGHQEGIYHRDLKPPNLLVDKDGVPRVIDFGLAAGPSVQDESGRRAREYGTAVGTPCYMAPEQFRGDPDLIDERSDVYGMGVVLYELLTGHLPYAVLGKHWREVGEIVQTVEPDPPRRFRRDLDDDLVAVLARALCKAPSERYQTMRELADDLGRWRAGEHTSARERSVSSRALASLRRRAVSEPKRALAAGALLSVVLASVFVRGLIADVLPLDGWLREIGSSARVALGDGPGELTSVRGISIDRDGVEAVAQSLGIEGVVPGDTQTYRELHGRTLEKLAEAEPRVVAIDIGFADRDDPGDPAFVRGIETLRDAGCPVVIAHPDWPMLTAKRRAIDADILGTNPTGVPTGEFSPEEGWRMDSAVQLPGEILATPSFSIATYMAMRYPDTPYFTKIDPISAEVVVTLGAVNAGISDTVGEEQRIPVTQVRPDVGKRGLVERGSRIAYTYLEIPSREALDRATLDLVELFDLPLNELRERLYQRVVVIGQSIPGQDWQYHPQAPVEGFKIQMVAIQSLLDNAPPRLATSPLHLLMMGLGAAVGLFIGFGGPDTKRHRLVLLAVTSLSVVAVSPLLVAAGSVFIGPLPVVAALVLAFVVADRVCSVRIARGLEGWAAVVRKDGHT